MASIWNWLRGRPAQPKRVLTDTVVPLHFLDSNKILTNVVIDLSLQFDHVLDVERLVGKLERLLGKPGWRKLGARIRCNEQGRYEYHVPATYTKDRPAVGFSQTVYDSPFKEHPVGSMLLRPTGIIEVSGETKAYRSMFVPDDSPSKLEDWLCSDRPQIILHTVSFLDATLLTITWPHTLMDAVSLQLLLQAWTAMLEDREHDVPEFDGEFEDPLATLGMKRDPKLNGDDFIDEEFILKDRLVTGWKFFLFVFNLLWDLLFYRKEEIHYMTIPPTVFSALRAESLSSLAVPVQDGEPPVIITPDRSNTSTSFLSDGDILCAWWVRLVTSSLPTSPRSSPTRTIQVLNVFNMQDLLSSTAPALLMKDRAYVHNCFTYVQSFFTRREILTLPLGNIAARLRADLVLQTTRPQMEARWRLQREEDARSGNPPLYGEGDMQLLPFSNWHKARIFDVDFSAAVVGWEGRGDGIVAKPVYAMPHGTVRGMPLRNSGSVLGRDGKGNWWIGGILTSETWRNVEQAIAMMNEQARPSKRV